MLVIGNLGFQFAFLWWCVVVPAIGYLIRRRWKAAAARQKVVKRLLALASEEADRAELEARYEYGKGYWNGNGNVIGEVRGGVVDRDVSQYSSSHCAVCFRPTSRRCSRCKAVRYCSGECQIFHWRKGHKDECLPSTYSVQNDEGFHVSEHEVKQNDGDDAVVDLESREKQHSNLGIESSYNGFELNDPTLDVPPSGNRPSRESIFPHGALRELDISGEQNPSSLTDKLTDGRSTEVMIEKEPVKLEPTTIVQAIDNRTPGDHKRDSNGRAYMSSDASGNSLDEMVSSDRPNHSNAQQDVKAGVMGNSNEAIVNGDAPKSSTDLRFSFDFPQSLSSELYTQGLKGLFPYESFVKLYNWNKVELLPSGLVNCGNSCYANVVLQCLAFTPPLTAYFLQELHSRSCVKRGWCLTCELERLVLEAKDGRSPLSPFRIVSHLQSIGSHLAGGKEEDAHDFLRCAVDSMQSICFNEAGISLDNGVGGKPSSYEEETNLIGLTFGGYLRSKIRCLRCRKKSQHNERFMDLSLEIDGDIETLEEALERFTGTEILDGENKYHCEGCNSYERAKKKLVVAEAPNVLSITLKRYRSGIYGKLNKSIKFPEILNFAPYMGEPSDKSPIYRLYGVVVHLDNMNSTFSGHYICYVRNAQMKWFAIDDSSVRLLDQERVMGRDAYMLFYSRCSPRAPRSIRDSIIPRAVMIRSKHSEEDRSKAGARIVSSRAGHRSTQSQSAVSYIPLQNRPRLHMRPPKSAEVDLLSDSSSIFSHSDEASSTSTDSNRDTSSTDDLFDPFFRDGRYGRNYGFRGFPDSDSSSSSSPSSSPPHPKRSPLSNSKRYASCHSQPRDTNDDNTRIDSPAVAQQENGGSLRTFKARGEGSLLRYSGSSLPASKLVYSSSCRETDSERLGWPNKSDDVKPSTVYLRRSSSKRVD